MMEGQPIKFRILEVLEERPMWIQDIVRRIQTEYSMKSDYGRAMINYDVVELVSAGMVKEGECKIDEEGIFKKDHLLTCYSLTSFGATTLDDLKAKVGGS